MSQNNDSSFSCSRETVRIFSVVRNEDKERKSIGVGYNEGRWTKSEHKIFVSEVLTTGIKNWKKVELHFNF
jgi:hypothetical protein